MKPLLSICIPTFNRAEYLNELLENLIISANGYEKDIELVIANNASTDSTEKVVNKYRHLFSHYQYFRHEECMLPPDKNFFFAISQSTGRYVWLIGDDDKVSRPAIKAIITMLHDNIDICVCNFSIVSKDFSELYKKRYFNPNLPGIINDKSELLKKFGPLLSFISIIVMRRSIIMSVDYKKYLSFTEYGLSFLYAVYSNLPKKLRGRFIPDPIVLNRAENSSVADWDKYFVTGTITILKELLHHEYNKMDIRQAKEITISNYILRTLLHMKATNKDTKLLFQKLSRDYKDTFGYWLKCIPIIVLPNSIFWGLRLIYQKLKNIRADAKVEIQEKSL